jgi:hypothetical protein
MVYVLYGTELIWWGNVKINTAMLLIYTYSRFFCHHAVSLAAHRSEAAPHHYHENRKLTRLG